MTQLSKTERTTLNAAMDIILKHTPKDASWMIHARNYASRPCFDVTYFDSHRTQHSNLWQGGDTFADKVQLAIGIEGDAAANADAARVRRIEALQSELLALTGEAA